MKKKYKHKFSKNRVVLSDVLPYEVPPIFSNRFFYKFLNSMSVEFQGVVGEKNDAKIVWVDKESSSPEEKKVIERIMRLMFSASNFNDSHKYKDFGNGKYSLSISSKDVPKIPFSFDIAHKEHELRKLTIPHLLIQVLFVDFYDKYRDLIIYYSSKSVFSLRKPKSTAKSFYFRDKIHAELNHSDINISIEEFEKEYESLKSYFVYEKYSNIFKFFESHLYHRAEKKYKKLVRLDISKCFDSIYTHSISWAILDKHEIKKNISAVGNFFSGQFDALMQKSNYNETNGIIIGPEFSRIFAELILQEIDLNLSKDLSDKSLRRGIDYDIFRYVDDYFVFVNEQIVQDEIVKKLQAALNKYKLSLNREKIVSYEKPIITETTIAKNKISNLLNSIKFNISENKDDSGSIERKGSIYVDENSLIVSFKTILKESGAHYKDVLNYSLASLESKVDKIFEDYLIIQNQNEKKLISALIGIVEFMFFIYSASQKVSYTIKVCRILQKIIIQSNKIVKNKDLKQHLFKEVSDNINFILKKNSFDEHVHVETLYLLITLSELGRTYKLSQSNVAKYFGFPEDKDKPGRYLTNEKLNYFSITCLLFYIKNYKDYLGIKEALDIQIKSNFNKADVLTREKSTELSLLLFDVLSCPYVGEKTKFNVLQSYGINSRGERQQIISYCKNKNWFTKWSNYNIQKELELKKSLEVY